MYEQFDEKHSTGKASLCGSLAACSALDLRNGEPLYFVLQRYGTWFPLRRDYADAIFHVLGRPKDGLYEPALADNEREAVADLLQYLENVRVTAAQIQ